MLKRIVYMVLIVSSFLPIFLVNRTVAFDFPAVLSIRDRTDLVLQITRKRLNQLIPKFMRQTGFDMWIITCNEETFNEFHLSGGYSGKDSLILMQTAYNYVYQLKPLVKLGGYIPCPDHRIPLDAKWENVQYYCDKMKEAFW